MESRQYTVLPQNDQDALALVAHIGQARWNAMLADDLEMLRLISDLVGAATLCWESDEKENPTLCFAGIDAHLQFFALQGITLPADEYNYFVD